MTNTTPATCLIHTGEYFSACADDIKQYRSGHITLQALTYAYVARYVCKVLLNTYDKAVIEDPRNLRVRIYANARKIIAFLCIRKAPMQAKCTYRALAELIKIKSGNLNKDVREIEIQYLRQTLPGNLHELIDKIETQIFTDTTLYSHE